jgi:lipopolysaccharide biosynthesis glycosyltransferase
MQPLRIFVGYDHRQPVAFTTLAYSIYSKSSKPVSITPLVITQLPLKRTGLTPFTFSRFMVPYLCGYKGWGLFLDIDIILNDDISKLFDLADDRYSVLVAKNEKRFEWASVMLFNNAKCQFLTPEYIETADDLHRISWCNDEDIGSLPPEWNHLVGYDSRRETPSLIHYTQGIPAFPETDNSEHADLWFQNLKESTSATSWVNLMGTSVHSAILNIGEGMELKVPRYYLTHDGKSVNPAYSYKIKELAEAKYGTS